MDAERLCPCPSLPAAAATAALSMVLYDDDLLEEILLRLVFPTSLVRAALICRRWLRVVSNQAFLRRFRDLHPPRLLGFYLNTARRGSPWFIATPQPPAELAAAVRLAGSIHETVSGMATILECQNGRLLAERTDNTWVIINPLHPARERDAVILPPRPYAECGVYTMCLTTDGVACAARIATFPRLGSHVVHELRGGTWHSLSSTALDLPLPGPPVLIPRPVNGKMYLMCCAIDIAKLPSELSELPYLSIIVLPHGVECKHKGNVRAWTDDSGVYLVQVKELQLRVWIYMTDSGKWLLQTTICLGEVCAQLGVADLASGDGLISTATDIKIRDVGHSAEFVLLQVGFDVLYIHIKSRNAEKVYTVKPEESGTRLVPFMMIWPPNFPVRDGL
ncbi:hypothetical protein EJB05_54449, partial [Eragrostis curvula]